MIRCRDGLMTEESVYYDQLERLRQIGSQFTLDGREARRAGVEGPPSNGVSGAHA